MPSGLPGGPILISGGGVCTGECGGCRESRARGDVGVAAGSVGVRHAGTLWLVAKGAGEDCRVPECSGEGSSAAWDGEGSQRRAGWPACSEGEPSDPDICCATSGGEAKGPSCGSSIGDTSTGRASCQEAGGDDSVAIAMRCIS